MVLFLPPSFPRRRESGLGCGNAGFFVSLPCPAGEGRGGEWVFLRKRFLAAAGVTEVSVAPPP